MGTADVGAYVTGWNHGQLDAVGGAICSCSVHTNLSVQSSVTRPGRPYALQVAHSSSFDYWWKTAANNFGEIIGYVYHQVATLPGADVVSLVLHYYTVFVRHHGVGIHNGHYATFVQSDANAIVWGADGPAVVAGQWVRLEAKSSHVGTTITTDGYADGVALGSCSTTMASVGVMWGITLGNNNASGLGNPNSPTFTEYFADLLMEQNAGSSSEHFPSGDYTVEMLLPNRDGTNVNGSSFSDDASNSPPNPTWSRLDDNPPSTSSTDWVQQDTFVITAHDYLEFGFTSLVSPLAPMQVQVVVLRTPPSNITVYENFYIEDGATQYRLYSGAGNIGAENHWWSGDTIYAPGSIDGTPWTTARVNALLVHWGFKEGTAPTYGSPRIQAVFLEVAVQVATDGPYWGIQLQ